MRKLVVSLAALAAALATPALAQSVVITNARVLTAGPAGEIAHGLVMIDKGKITAVMDQSGTSLGVFAPGTQVIDAQGGVVTPGFIAPNALLGAVEVRSLGDDVVANNPDIGAAFDVQYALNPASTLIPVARMAGITRAVVTPVSAGGGGGGADFHADDGEELMTAGGGGGTKSAALFAGQAALIHLGEATDILVKPKVGMVVPFGDGGANVAGGARGAEIVALQTAFRDVRDYMRNKAAYDRAGVRDLALSKADLEALIPVIEGRMPIIAVVQKASDIRAVLKFAREEKIRVILSGAEEGWMAAREIAAAGVPVILDPLSSRPQTFQTLGASLENAAKLDAAGVTVVLQGSGGAHRIRELRYNAGNAVAYGMPYQAALAAMTINPAKVFGVADKVGSLEPGKDADVVIWTADPFEPLSQPTAIFIRGEAQPLTSRQIELRDRYKDLSGPYPPAYSR
ncbi:imidazolonepropionase-like amidohydrolase [Phenylobacterium haematophilum]|uniref:Imidazolonepropionase-like amidohydrolase n=1 Tax=Phenylobacterium haematophilum TaxID=98513 RepID=A0A840A8E0_9CAUL|nr:amidohydrolase family protein [Phenylobacterium haematophilum]MBB3893457.1 imidazolonepropionase-like amidohydrolase [Phenylobacterium haematophilum]